MMGCCGAESEKFRNEDFSVDQKRLDKLVEEKRKDGWRDFGIKRMAECRCPCHVDGVICLC
jgi:hypothetical protein